MLLTVGTFCERVESDLAALIDELRMLTGRGSDAETTAWQRSLPKLSVLLASTRLMDFDLLLGAPGSLSLEYRLPVSSSWCDAVLLGRGPERPAAVMLELKDWATEGDRPAERPGLIEHHGELWSHPADQLRGYVDYCRMFHSAVLASRAEVSGCVFFTSARNVEVYRQAPYESLVADYPVYAVSDMPDALPEYLGSRLMRPYPEFARSFENGTYAQDRNLLRQVSRDILGGGQFVLLDEQRRGYELCLQRIDEHLRAAGSDDKVVIIIEGPPGSGKSVVAARLWAALARDPRIGKNVVMTTTSSSQRSNWRAMFRTLRRGAEGIIVSANRYNPGLTAGWLGRQREQGHAVTPASWRANLTLFEQTEGLGRSQAGEFAVSIVDEAHALIDPSLSGIEGVSSSGWLVQAGPQAWHIIRASRVSIFLMDSEQSYRDNETTSQESIEACARDLGLRHIERISLGDAQFRCGGSRDYLAWVGALLDSGGRDDVHTRWRRTASNPTGSFTFDVVPDPQALDERLRERLAERRSARLVASYGMDWITKDVSSPHNLPASQQDFHIPYVRNGQHKVWTRVWNYAPGQNYELFIQAPPGTRMHNDPLSEVGCPYVVRGFDYDWLGLLWLRDLVWRGDKWQVDLSHVHEIAWSKTLAAAKAEQRAGPLGPGTAEIIRRLQRGYRILLSRAIHGLYVWFEDEETRRHVEALLSRSGL